MDRNGRMIIPELEDMLELISSCVREFVGHNINQVIGNTHVPFANNATFNSSTDHLSSTQEFSHCITEFFNRAYDHRLNGSSVSELMLGSSATSSSNFSSTIDDSLNNNLFYESDYRRNNAMSTGNIVVATFYLCFAMIGVAYVASKIGAQVRRAVTRRREVSEDGLPLSDSISQSGTALTTQSSSNRIIGIKESFLNISRNGYQAVSNKITDFTVGNGSGRVRVVRGNGIL